MTSVCLRKLLIRNVPTLRGNFKPHKIPIIKNPILTQSCRSFCVLNKYPEKLISQSQYAVIRWNSNDCDPPKKLTTIQKFKQMYRDYWYVLVPVHIVTSAVWFGGFYYLAKSGVDIVGLLETWNVSEKITNPLKGNVGYIAVTYALYKISTPLRYTVTVGGTMVSIKYLREWGYIKPAPSTDQLKEMYKERKEEFILKKEQLRDKKDHLLEDFSKGIKKMRGTGENLKEKKKQVLHDIESSITNVTDSRNPNQRDDSLKPIKTKKSGL